MFLKGDLHHAAWQLQVFRIAAACFVRRPRSPRQRLESRLVPEVDWPRSFPIGFQFQQLGFLVSTHALMQQNFVGCVR